MAFTLQSCFCSCGSCSPCPSCQCHQLCLRVVWELHRVWGSRGSLWGWLEATPLLPLPGCIGKGDLPVAAGFQLSLAIELSCCDSLMLLPGPGEEELLLQG